MPNTREREKVRALVSAFNVNNYDFNAVKTNFKLQSRGKKDYIVVSFDKSMDTYQCRRYLDNIQRKIIREFYGIEESNDAEISDTAELIFDVNSFPFDISDRDWSWDKQHGFKFVTPVDEGVIFNLKSHLAFSLKKDVQEDMLTYITSQPFDKKKYLWRGEFDNKGLRKQFEREFLSRMRERYENAPKNPLKVEGNSVYIRDVFDDARFIDSITRRAAWRIGIDLGVGNDVDHSVKLLKDSIINSVYQSTKIIVVGFICASPLNREEASILIPLVLCGRGKRILTSEEALKLNYAFDGAVFYNLYDRTQGELSINKSGGIYGIDFSNPEISHCVITKIIESSVINKDHELAIDPGLRLQALSPAQSPFNSPMHAGPSGLRTPPNQRKKDTDSGYDSNSPPKPKDSVAHSPSGVPGPSTELSYMECESPTPSPDGALDGPPRQWSEREEETGRMFQLLLGEIGQASTSSQQTDMPSSSYTYIDKRDESMPEDSYFLPSMLTSFPHVITPSVRYGIPRRPILLTTKNDQKSSSREFSARSPCFEDVNILGMKSEEHDKSEQGACSQVGVRALEGAQADDESMLIEIRGQQVRYRLSLTPPLIAWDDSTFLNLEVSNEEPEKQQVTDKSDRKSSDEYSEAKSQDSKSTEKKHGGGFFCKEGPLAKLSPFKRRSVERDTMCSSKSDLVYHVTEKSHLSKRSASERRAKSNSPSKMTSPTHEGVPEWQQRLNPDQREELHPLLSPELRKKLDSNSLSPELRKKLDSNSLSPELRKKLDSNSLSPEDEQLKHLLYTPSGQEKMKKNFESQEENLRRSVNAQLPANPSSKNDRDSGFCSIGSPAMRHKGSVSSKVKECDLQQAKYMSKALEKN